MTPERRYDLERSRYGNRCLVVATSMEGVAGEDFFGDGSGVEVSSNAKRKRPVASRPAVIKKPKTSVETPLSGHTTKKPVASKAVAVAKPIVATAATVIKKPCYTDKDDNPLLTVQAMANKYGSSDDWKFFTSNSSQLPSPVPVEITIGRAFILPRDYPPFARYLTGEASDFLGWMGTYCMTNARALVCSSHYPPPGKVTISLPFVHLQVLSKRPWRVPRTVSTASFTMVGKNLTWRRLQHAACCCDGFSV